MTGGNFTAKSVTLTTTGNGSVVVSGVGIDVNNDDSFAGSSSQDDIVEIAETLTSNNARDGKLGYELIPSAGTTVQHTWSWTASDGAGMSAVEVLAA